MSVLIEAESIRKQAKKVLDELGLVELVESFGQLYFTGSYALDLMTWNDIDMQVVIDPKQAPMDAFLTIFEHIAKKPCFVRANLINFKGDYKPRMPRGLCLGVYLDFPDLGGMWKFDLWALESKDFEANRHFIEELERKLNPDSRRHILEIKRQLMKETGRVPQLASYYLYQAILFEGLEENKAIMDYLRGHGVNI